MKKNKLRLVTEILAVVVICLISFVGIYKQEYNKMENQVIGYELEKDLSGYREVVFKVSDATEVLDSDGAVVGDTNDYDDDTIESNSYEKTDTKVNSDEDLTEENYKKAKEIIETRLTDLGVQDYVVSVNYEDGTIYLQLPENSSTDHIISNIVEVAEFQIRDSEDDEQIYITNDDIKYASAVYNTTTSGTTVYLQIEFNKNGTNVLTELSSGDYATIEEEEETDESTEETETDESEEETEDESDVEAEVEVTTEDTSGDTAEEEEVAEETEEETTEESEDSEATDEETDSEESEEEETQKQIILSIDGTDMITTSFDEPIENGVIDLSMNTATTDTEEISDSLQSTSTIAILLNSGKMPLTYTITYDIEANTDISQDALMKAIYGTAIIVAIAVIVLIIKHKVRGILATIAFIGFVALDLLLIRYTNVSISLESIVAGVIVLVIHYLCVWNLLNIKETDIELKKKVYNEKFKDIIIILLPIFIISIVFTFIEWTKIATFGMFLFWGVLLSVLYNYIITKDMIG